MSTQPKTRTPKVTAPTARATRPAGLHVAVVGAGMAGVVCARTLVQAGHRVTLLEKSRGLGGRMSTRHTEFGGFDHGSQYFTVRDARFETALRSNATSVVRPWSASTVRVLDEFGHATRTQPTHHVAGDFIAHEIAENGGMPAVCFDCIDHRLLDLAARFALVEEFDVLGPGNGNEATNAVLRTGVEEPARRHIIDAHKIEPGLVHHGEVGLCFVR